MEVKVSGNFKAIFHRKNVPRLLERHFPERIPPTEKKARQRKRSVVGYKRNRRKETVFQCPKCEAALCVEENFKAFHTKLNLYGKL